ncbi:obscurin-like [Danio aesculapii]|uniref:obscurin-like n=1 Tax=Danio aesculapii TaxID=1142201 RepID=UPI0024BF1846|nr:obscurin-like [Danio aesculapii]
MCSPGKKGTWGWKIPLISACTSHPSSRSSALISILDSGFTQALPRSTVTVTPDSAVFTGETVNLKCVIESDHSFWTYEWYNDRNCANLQSDGHYTVNRDTLTIRGAAESDQGQYWCRGLLGSVSTQSCAVYLSVKERPKPVVKVRPDQRVFIGETVTLKCDIQTGGNIEWIKYSWIKDGDTQKPYRTTSAAELSFRADSVSVSGQYSCRGERSDSQRSDISAAVTLTVSERPKPVVKVRPDQRVFIGETVTLKCDIQTGGNIEWIKYSWIKDGDTQKPYRTTSAAELSFRADSVSVSGQYSCRGERSDSQRSDISAAVTLTVSALPRSTVTVTPDSAVFTGETVNLKCVIESGHRDWTYEWVSTGVEDGDQEDQTHHNQALLFISQ